MPPHRPLWRYALVVVAILLSLHLVLTVSHDGYGRATSLTRLTGGASGGTSGRGAAYTPDAAELARLRGGRVGDAAPGDGRRADAVLFMLARNSDVNQVADSMKQLEDRFNRRFGYPWVFLNDEPFSDEFIQRTSILTAANVSYGVIPAPDWNQPEWIDEAKAKAGRDKLEADNVIYGGSVSYRNMCRFNSGFFFRHELLRPYRWYWRVEPDVKFFCDLDYDPFLMMQDAGKVYGFTIALYEFESTIPTLWEATQEFMSAHPEHVAQHNALAFLSDNGGEAYNMCHFWSNFEIADMAFWRAPAYSAFFDFLEARGGFYYERWGDAPVHSIAAALFARADQLHAFRDIGYRHGPFQHCPAEPAHALGRCWCDPKDSFDYDGYSCMRRWDDVEAHARR